MVFGESGVGIGSSKDRKEVGGWMEIGRQLSARHTARVLSCLMKCNILMRTTRKQDDFS